MFLALDRKILKYRNACNGIRALKFKWNYYFY